MTGKNYMLCGNEIVEKTEWPRPIPVTERLPEEGDLCLAYDAANLNESGDYRWQSCLYCDAEFLSDWTKHNVALDGVTHWLPMPPKPE